MACFKEKVWEWAYDLVPQMGPQDTQLKNLDCGVSGPLP